MKECEKIQDLLSQYIDHMLEEETVSVVEEHLSRCEECRDYLHDLFKLSDTLKTIERVSPPSDFLKKMHQRIESRESLNKFLKNLFKQLNIKVSLSLLITTFFIIISFKLATTYYLKEKLYHKPEAPHINPPTSLSLPTPASIISKKTPSQPIEESSSLKDRRERQTISKIPPQNKMITPLKEKREEEKFIKKKEKVSTPTQKVIPPKASFYTLTIEVTDINKAREKIFLLINRVNTNTFSAEKKQGEEENPNLSPIITYISAENLRKLVEKLHKLSIGKISLAPPLPAQSSPQIFPLRIYIKETSSSCLFRNNTMLPHRQLKNSSHSSLYPFNFKGYTI
ncbi:MAG: hypothetical protein B6D56_05030 [Candidatus Omnitrophica bacterium 4484_70.1]|nr:MAG: hypothetical protein B6D56_05030 [Candidatus Omnitrophica bacterium 4484_70.1]